MRDRIKNLLDKIEQVNIENAEQAEQFRLEFLSKKGELNNLFADFKNVLNEDKKEIGALINQLKEKGILAGALGPKYLRLVTHLDLTDGDIEVVNQILPQLLQRALVS
jgi:phenylalanyl-tRNA synthetase alpha subunit